MLNFVDRRLSVYDGGYFNEILLSWDDFDALLKSFQLPTRFVQVLAFGAPVSKTICTRVIIDATQHLLVGEYLPLRSL